MKVDAPAASVTNSASALAPIDAQRVPAGTSKLSTAIAEAPLPVVGAANRR